VFIAQTARVRAKKTAHTLHMLTEQKISGDTVPALSPETYS
jgi:hypothetical protein